MVALSRRDFVVVGGSALLLAGCGSGGGDDTDGQDGTTTTRGSAVMGDIELLNALLDMENEAAAVYDVVAPMLKGRALDAAKLLGEHERAHADELEKAIRDLGGTPNTPEEPDLPALEDAEAALMLALGRENTAVAAYIDALPKLSEPELRGTAASIVTNEAEHIAVLLGVLDKPQVPEAYVLGRRT